MIQFTQLTEAKYISSSRFSLVKYNDRYQILLNSRIPNWSGTFSSIECAENFLNSHDYIHASLTHMPMSSDDIEFIIDMYGFDNVGKGKWAKQNRDKKLSLFVHPNEPKITIFEDKPGKLFSETKRTFSEAIDAIDYLDSIDSCTAIKCASAREIAQKLVRVKSSNLWAYAIDIKDRHDKTGTVYVQFKGKNGGPGDLYRYFDVPVTLWRKWLGFPSKGNFHWKYIRFAFPYEKLTGDKHGKLKNAVR